jgi:hypothetical protein
VSQDILDLIKKMGEKETALTERTFVSPIFSAREVATRVDGIAYTFAIPKAEPGWYNIRPIDTKRARLAGKAELQNIETYLKCLGKIRLVLVMKKDDVYMAVPDKINKHGMAPQQLVPVFLTDDTVLDFDRVLARYDGANLWFESVDMGNDPQKAEHLRTSLETLVEPSKIKCAGLTFEERLAYTLRLTLDQKLVEDRKKQTIEGHVEHAGGKLLRFAEKKDHISVTYTVDGEQFTSHVSKDPAHQVIAAGICLAGNDKRFDLKSLITVVREARKRRVVHRFNIEDPGFRDPYANRHGDDDEDDEDY